MRALDDAVRASRFSRVRRLLQVRTAVGSWTRVPAATPRASPAHFAHFTAHCTTSLAAVNIYSASLEPIRLRQLRYHRQLGLRHNILSSTCAALAISSKRLPASKTAAIHACERVHACRRGPCMPTRPMHTDAALANIIFSRGCQLANCRVRASSLGARISCRGTRAAPHLATCLTLARHRRRSRARRHRRVPHAQPPHPSSPIFFSRRLT